MLMREPSTGRLFVDLDGPGGNVFSLIGVAKELSRQIGLDEEAVAAEMKQGDYSEALRVFRRYFGSLVTLATRSGRPDLE